MKEFQINQIYNYDFTITKEVYFHFQKCSNDMNPLHTNYDFAKSKGFPDLVMYGNILNAFISFFIGECLPLKNVIIHSQNIAFKNAVYLNEKLEFEAIVSGIYDAVNAVEFKYKFKKNDGKIAAKGEIQIGLIL